MTRYPVPLIALALLALAAFVGPVYGSYTAPDRPAPALPQDYDLPAIVLADRPGGLELVSAPLTLSLTLGHVAYLPVEVQGYHRPITITGQTLIHTFVNDQTPAEPGAAPPFVVGVLNAGQSELKLQTLRMREHPMTLSFQADEPVIARSVVCDEAILGDARDCFGAAAPRNDGGDIPVTFTLTLAPIVQPHTPLFSIHSAPFYDGLPEPYIRIWGPQCDYCDPAWPDCAPCPTTPGDPPGTTRDVGCGKVHDKWDTCRCRHLRPAYDPAADARTRRQAPALQRYASQFLRNGAGGWTGNSYQPGDYLWDRLDWLFGLSSQERDYAPLLTDIIQGNGGWLTCQNYPVTNPDGSIGFFDPNNAYLAEQYRLYVRELAARYAPELRFLETHNEPCYGFYLCPCLDDPAGPAAACNASGGPNQYVCDFIERPYGHESEEFAQVYGPFLSLSANVASEELAAANPEALLVAGALEKTGSGLTATTRYMIEHGLLDRGNVAVMIHQFPYPSPPDWIEHEPCVYSGFYYLPPGCETAPPMEDYTSITTGRPVSARGKWLKMDRDMDVSEILHDAQESGRAVAGLPTEPAVAGLLTEPLDRFYLFDTELHAGFYVKDETTTVGRAAIAGLRVAAINAHQRFAGMEFIGAAEDPAAYNLLVQQLAGATPVYTTTAPLMDADYSGLVYKLFTRPVGQVPGTSLGEDIIAFWSNAETPLRLALTLAATPARFKQVTLTRFTAPRCADVRCVEARDRLDIASEDLTAPPATVAVLPRYDFYFLSVISDRPDFDWLAGLNATPDHRLYLPMLTKGRGQPAGTPTATATASATPTRTPSSTSTLTPTPTPTVTPALSPAAIVLADRAGGLELVSAPLTLSLTVGHVAYLPVELLGYRRPITVSAQTLIHTYVNDQTAAAPGDAVTLTVGTLAAARSELSLQTLRLRPHPLTLTFEADAPVIARSVLSGARCCLAGVVEGCDEAISFNARDCFGVATPRNDVGNVLVSVAITLQPAIAPDTPVFGTHPDSPAFGGLIQPFDRAWGPDCGACPTTPGDPPGSTRDVQCAKQLNDTCRCHPILEILDPRADAGVRRRAPELQRYAFQFVRGAGGWGGLQHAPGQYLWAGLDWLFEELSPQERDYSPLFTGVMDGNFGWMTCPQYTNPDGSRGFFDTDNAYLLEQYAANLRAITERYRPELRYVELSNEPAAEYYLCPCVAPGGTCDATSGPNQPACLLGPNAPEFVATYGDLLLTAAISGSQAMAAANPDALLVTGALDMPPNGFGLSLTTMNMITLGLVLNNNVAIGIHQYPYLNPPNWISPTLNCSYYQVPGDPYWLPPGCETAPPFEDFTTPAGKPIRARDAWRFFDTRVDLSLLLHDAADLGVLDRFYTFDTELHAGWHDGDPTTTPAREAMAGLRIAAINTHQRVLGTEFIFAPADPAAYNLLVKQMAGVTPVYTATAPLMDADYSDLVYKFFTREDEDIIAIWSNAEAVRNLVLNLAAGPVRFQRVTLTRFADAGGPLAITPTSLAAPPVVLAVQPVREFYFLSVSSDRPGFGWLAGF